jgi:hypothetical protein
MTIGMRNPKSRTKLEKKYVNIGVEMNQIGS